MLPAPLPARTVAECPPPGLPPAPHRSLPRAPGGTCAAGQGGGAGASAGRRRREAGRHTLDQAGDLRGPVAAPLSPKGRECRRQAHLPALQPPGWGHAPVPCGLPLHRGSQHLLSREEEKKNASCRVQRSLSQRAMKTFPKSSVVAARVIRLCAS